MVNYVTKELEQGASPSQLYTIRKQLTDGIANAPTSDLSQAARAARPQRMELIQQIDNILDEMSSGKWTKYLETYKEASPGITSKEALQKIVEKLREGQPIGTPPPVLGERPGSVTVGRLRDRYGQKQFGSQTLDRLQPEDRQMVEALINSLKAQSEGMTAPSILGSQTGALLANMGRADGVTQRAITTAAGAKVPGGNVLASRLFDAMGRKAENELAHLAQNPQALAAALERAAMARALMRGAQRTGNAAGMGLGAQQP
jgi:hypothetical protein